MAPAATEVRWCGVVCSNVFFLIGFPHQNHHGVFFCLPHHVTSHIRIPNHRSHFPSSLSLTSTPLCVRLQCVNRAHSARDAPGCVTVKGTRPATRPQGPVGVLQGRPEPDVTSVTIPPDPFLIQRWRGSSTCHHVSFSSLVMTKPFDWTKGIPSVLI